ncbi:MAG: 50S ribosomal protein L17 [Candidatus Roizmanbacteria bacterium GW2011_GWA2_36_23]|uniref:50S ribosomal protein L17 n=1 Tax=Candidatus Roizmanbacteria bacterium GW2011_GWA2_36_23 TaxID=1618480 RepID=A0A0G0HE32_9BACT|nr:MAG: 50S ribosomal protein L17 [Candidatus Roizmanbacteria bacterium GW2011_GWA2_36_23]
MRHRDKKIKFTSGQDANSMLVRKLLFNFFSKGKIKTTLSKIKILKSLVESTVEKMKEETEANKNYLLKKFGNKNLFPLFFKNIGVTMKEKKGGYVRVVRIGTRISDGSEIAQLEWTHPIVIEKPKEKISAAAKTAPLKEKPAIKKLKKGTK